MKILLPLTLLVFALALSLGCSTNRPSSIAITETPSDGPTVYGQLSVSLDHASTR
jgi:hypothetical protein